MSEPHQQNQRHSLNNGSTSYFYKPLDLEATSIRLLRIEGQTDQGLVQCTIRHTSVDSNFAALSYVWGSSSDQGQILLNGQAHTVRNNLYHFLSYARTSCCGIAFWIDAICIDQHNDTEKNHQVQIMSRIYSNARAVVIWLGQSGVRTEVGYGFDQLENLASSDGAQLEATVWLFDNSPPPIAAADFWNNLDVLLRTEYRKRGWTLQEFMLPLQGFVVASEHWISLEKLVGGLLCLRELTQDWKVRNTSRSKVRLARFDQEYWVSRLNSIQNSSGWSTVEKHNATMIHGDTSQTWSISLYLMSDHRYTTNIRDRIFSILGLTTRGSELRVDYSLDPFCLLLETLWFEKLEAGSGTCTAQAMNLLNLTPEIIAYYACSDPDRISAVWSQPARIGYVARETVELYLRSAASVADQGRWHESQLYSYGWAQRNEKETCRIHQTLHFPAENQCEARMRYSCTYSYTYFSVALYSVHPPVEEFLSRHSENCADCLVRGAYKTTCTPEPLTVLFALYRR